MIRINGFAGVAGIAVIAAWACGCGGGDVDQRVPAVPGGALTVDIELGSGVSFDRGSLEVTTHEHDEVHVIADVSGWGGYAVDLDISERNGDVRVIGRVDGALHWMFGGPTVDIRVVTPHAFGIDARIDGGDMLLEDLEGRVSAASEGNDITLLRADGEVKIASAGGKIRVEDVDGTLRADSGGGALEVSGIQGKVDLRAQSGNIVLSSVTGPVEVTTERGSIGFERIRGDVRATSERGGITADDIVGDLEVSTDRSRIQIGELSGSIRARSNRGGIDVAFASPPSGTIDTTRGSIRVEAPALGGFSVEADTRRGKIEIAERFAFVSSDPMPQVAAGPTAEEQIRALQDLGRQVAAEVKTRVEEQMEQMRDEWERRRSKGRRGWSPHEDWRGFEGWNPSDRSWPWESSDWKWPEPDLGWTHPTGPGGERWGFRDRRGDRLSGHINGGGPALRLRTDRGSIRIDTR